MSGVQPSSPPLFARRSMAAAAIGESIYFFGGVGAAGTESILDVSADLWSYDTAKRVWREIQSSGPWPSARRCVGWLALPQSLLLWGGSGISVGGDGRPRHNFLNDLWTFDPGGECWAMVRGTDDHQRAPGDVSPAFPSPRYTPVFQAVDDVLFLFGGYTEDRLGKRKLNDAWVCGRDGWAEIPRQGEEGYTSSAVWPGLRYGSMSASDVTSVYVCGGFADDGDHMDLWRFDMANRHWQLLAPESGSRLPEARYCAALTCYRRKLFLFGGRSRRFPKLNFNDLWEFDLDSGEWTMRSGNRSPHCYDGTADYPGYHAKASSVRVGASWYLWGGEGLRGHVSDFWRLHLDSLEWELLGPARSDDPVFW